MIDGNVAKELEELFLSELTEYDVACRASKKFNMFTVEIAFGDCVANIESIIIIRKILSEIVANKIVYDLYDVEDYIYGNEMGLLSFIMELHFEV